MKNTLLVVIQDISTQLLISIMHIHDVFLIYKITRHGPSKRSKSENKSSMTLETPFYSNHFITPLIRRLQSIYTSLIDRMSACDVLKSRH